MIAEGVYDCYPKFGRCSEWDTAAGVYILEGAGGTVLDLNNKPLTYNLKEDTLSPAFRAVGYQENLKDKSTEVTSFVTEPIEI